MTKNTPSYKRQVEKINLLSDRVQKRHLISKKCICCGWNCMKVKFLPGTSLRPVRDCIQCNALNFNTVKGSSCLKSTPFCSPIFCKWLKSTLLVLRPMNGLVYSILSFIKTLGGISKMLSLNCYSVLVNLSNLSSKQIPFKVIITYSALK